MWREVATGTGARLVVYTYHTEQPGTYGQDFPLLVDAPRFVLQPDGGLLEPEGDDLYHIGYEARDSVGTWPVVRVQTGEWHDMRLRVYLNDPGERNGSIQAWFDGVPVLNINGLLFCHDRSRTRQLSAALPPVPNLSRWRRCQLGTHQRCLCLVRRFQDRAGNLLVVRF